MPTSVQFKIRRVMAHDGEGVDVLTSPELPGLYVTADPDSPMRNELLSNLRGYADLIERFGVDGNVAGVLVGLSPSAVRSEILAATARLEDNTRQDASGARLVADWRSQAGTPRAALYRL
jgi:hypothetical protein